jgi:hypothetical protein
MKTLKTKVKIRKGFAAYFTILFNMFCISGVAYGLGIATFTGEVLKPSNFWLMLGLIFIAAFFMFPLYYLLPKHYMVTLEGIQIGTWKGKMFLPWKNVTQVMTKGFKSGPDLVLMINENGTARHIGLSLPFLAYYKYSAQAVIEAAISFLAICIKLSKTKTRLSHNVVIIKHSI